MPAAEIGQQWQIADWGAAAAEFLAALVSIDRMPAKDGLCQKQDHTTRPFNGAFRQYVIPRLNITCQLNVTWLFVCACLLIDTCRLYGIGFRALIKRMPCRLPRYTLWRYPRSLAYCIKGRLTMLGFCQIQPIEDWLDWAKPNGPGWLPEIFWFDPRVQQDQLADAGWQIVDRKLRNADYQRQIAGRTGD